MRSGSFRFARYFSQACLTARISYHASSRSVSLSCTQFFLVLRIPSMRRRCSTNSGLPYASRYQWLVPMITFNSQFGGTRIAFPPFMAMSSLVNPSGIIAAPVTGSHFSFCPLSIRRSHPVRKSITPCTFVRLTAGFVASWSFCQNIIGS